jgi:protein-tyrosine phosphatase
MSNFTQILDNLWMGGELLPALPEGFDAIVDCRVLEDIGVLSFTPKALLWIPFIDVNILPPAWLIDMGVGFVKTAIADKLKTLVHCAEGHNRSGLIVASYLIRCLSMTPDDAIALIRLKRPGALVNPTFVDYLLKTA